MHAACAHLRGLPEMNPSPGSRSHVVHKCESRQRVVKKLLHNKKKSALTRWERNYDKKERLFERRRET